VNSLSVQLVFTDFQRSFNPRIFPFPQLCRPPSPIGRTINSPRSIGLSQILGMVRWRNTPCQGNY